MTVRVWVLDTALPEDPITDRPRVTLDEQCHQAAAALLERHPALRRAIDGLYFGSMGMFAGDTSGRRLPSHIPNFLRAELHLTGLRGGSFNTYASTSESGGVALLRAFRDLAQGRVETALVVAGEQMFSPSPTARPRDRAAIGAWIRGVLDPREAEPHALSMLPIGDLLMDHLAWSSGMPGDLWREVTEAVTLDKYRAAALHSHTMQGARERDRGPTTCVGYGDERTNPWVTPLFRRDDVCASANGATALLLTTRLELLPPGGPRVRIVGMGEGTTNVTFAGRGGPLHRFAAIRSALRQLLRGAGLDASLLRDRATTGAILHDAFPSIELAFLAELSDGPDWPWVLDRFVSGWSHPLGGLCGGGHALGNSGLFQAASATHLLTRDERYLRGAPAETPGAWLLTNVGSALTSVVATLLADEARPEVAEALTRAHRQRSVGERPFAPVVEDAVFGAATEALPTGGMIVAARTRTVHPEHGPTWVYLGHTREGTRFARHDGAGGNSETPYPVGAAVRLTERGGALCATGGGELAVRAPTMPDGDRAAVRRMVESLRSGRLADRWPLPPGP